MPSGFTRNCVFLILGINCALSCDRRPFLKINAYVYSRRDRLHLVNSVNIQSLKDYDGIEVTNVTVPQLCEGAVTNLPRLTSLSLNNLGIQEIEPGVFRNLHRITHLSLALNNITTIKEGIFNNLSATTLYLSMNLIRTVEEKAFDGMVNLQEINLDRNIIKQINPMWFKGLNRIRKINLAFNLIEEVPQRAFGHFEPEETVRIDLNHNNIRTFSRSALKGDEDWMILELAYNKIDEFNIAFFRTVKHIQELNLKGNEIECLSDEVLTYYVNTPIALNLQKNPINCRCLVNFDRFKRAHYKENFNYSSTHTCTPLYSF